MFSLKPQSSPRVVPQPSELEGVGYDLRQFFEDCVEPKADSHVSMMQIWNRYKAWCERTRQAPVAFPVFSEEFQELAIKAVGHVHIHYRGAHFFMQETTLKPDGA